MRNSHLYCTACQKVGHLNDRCWVTYPDLQRKKKVHGVEGEQAEVPTDGIRIGAIDTCGCDALENPPSVSPCISSKSTRSFAQTTAACSDNLSVVDGPDNLSVVGGFVKPRVSNRYEELQADGSEEEDDWRIFGDSAEEQFLKKMLLEEE